MIIVLFDGRFVEKLVRLWFGFGGFASHVRIRAVFSLLFRGQTDRRLHQREDVVCVPCAQHFPRRYDADFQCFLHLPEAPGSGAPVPGEGVRI